MSALKNCSAMIIREFLHNRSVFGNFKRNCSFQPNVKQDTDKESFERLIQQYGAKIKFNSVIDAKSLSLGYKKIRMLANKLTKQQRKDLEKLGSFEPLPITLKYVTGADIIGKTESKAKEPREPDKPNTIQFPYVTPISKISENYDLSDTQQHQQMLNSTEAEIRERQSIYKEHFSNWMMDYENYDDTLQNEEDNDSFNINYGTPDPKCEISNIPCGGCGALLHCKDTAIPGYIPSEIYKNYRKLGGVHLSGLICQRCHFLKHYDMALQVRVADEDYAKVLETIRGKHALIVLMVDLLDFPCSIWPGIADLIGKKVPVVVVGNKIDLIPQDSTNHLKHVQEVLQRSVHMMGLTTNIQHVALISAKTGWGVEELINQLHNLWSTKGDVYLVGCTNVGKSTLFNCLLQSDYCKAQAADLIQRATTSRWPGTTLNLLKFPILRPSGWRLYARTKRLQSLNKVKALEDKLRKIQLQENDNTENNVSLLGHMERTFMPDKRTSDSVDPFSVQGHANSSGKVRVGISENDSTFKLSKWCYDTPGVVQPDQLIHLLTVEELMLTLPKNLVQPRTFSIKPGTAIFIAALARIDYITGPNNIRLTVFCSDMLPITVCNIEDAELLYEKFLGSEAFKVPANSPQRLENWPNLKATDSFTLTGEDWDTSCADIVLSSTGWVSVTCGFGLKVTLKGWTPTGKGVHVRECLLPKAVTLRGQKIRGSPAYKKSQLFVK